MPLIYLRTSHHSTAIHHRTVAVTVTKPRFNDEAEVHKSGKIYQCNF